METREIHVYGLVQGVGFRWCTQILAKKFFLKGWVRNENDGSVTILIQGKDYILDKFIQELPDAQGPTARIDKIEQKQLPNVAPLTRFTVKY